MAMKVQINLDVASAPEAAVFDLAVNSQDTVLCVKERVAAAQLIALPEQDLVLDGEVLDDSQKLSDYKIKDGMRLDFVVKASPASLTQQLVELLQPRDLSCSELGLLYCYKYGANINQALKTVGHVGKLQDFLRAQKPFRVESGSVALIRESATVAAAPPPSFSAKHEVTQFLQAAGGSLNLAALCSRFSQKFHVTLADVGGEKPADFLVREGFFIKGSLVSLRSLSPPPPPPPGLATSVPVAQQTPGEADSQEYLELHAKIASRSFNSKAVTVLNEVEAAVRQRLFVKVEHAVKGGSVGKGTAISGAADAEIVLFLAAVSAAAADKWLPPLLKAVAAVLEDSSQDLGIQDVRATGDSVRLTCGDAVEVSLRFSPAFESHGAAVEALREQEPMTRKLLATAFAKERALFVAKQPGQVKVTIRLLKWWRDQQRWSSEFARPSDDVLELVAVYSAVQTKPADQRVAIANVMALLAKFDELRVVWSNFYDKEAIWPPLLRQRPLLMDPANPFLNVADTEVFDSQELMAKAGSTHFFW